MIEIEDLTSKNPMSHTTNTLPYILESNPHSVFDDFLNRKKLVHGSNPHLSFNHPLPIR
jgi:hypothetical protein